MLLDSASKALSIARDQLALMHMGKQLDRAPESQPLSAFQISDGSCLRYNTKDSQPAGNTMIWQTSKTFYDLNT